MSTIQTLLRRGVTWCGRRVSIKRLQTDGNYESEWFDITSYVNSFGIVKKSFGDTVFLGNTQIEGMSIQFDNSSRKFNDESEYRSLWSGFLTRYRTKFKIELFFYDDDGSEVSGLNFYGILYSSPTTSDSAVSVFSIATMLKVFQKYPADGIDTTGSPDTATLIDRLVKKSQNSVRIFDQFFEGSSDSEKYDINPEGASVTTISSPNILKSKTVWGKMVDYSFIDNAFPYIDSSGNFVWSTKDETSSEKWQFHGAGSSNNDYGINIISVDEQRDGLENTWNRVAIEYATDTFSVSEANWTPGDLSSNDKFGDRTFEYSLTELTSGEASTVASTIRDAYKEPKREWDITTIITPHLELKDKVSLNYIGEINVENPFIFGASTLGGPDVFGGYSNSISLNDVTCKIISMEHDLDELVSRFTLREV